ncbi:hypothetical protein LTR97_004160 [Elasticomyces elasticus]|uniref:BTB domain-containing protein n=1 Tax=Elasticomyces elasticus TaxID=574655 RepID=A0AAN7W9U6_9PEZI|nr:hypothetical protein LTR97_004160 [Elasticomyces elasticus]
MAFAVSRIATSTERANKHPEEPWLDRKYSDMKIVCENEEFLVHSVIVCNESPVLDSQFEELFKAQKKLRQFADVTDVTIKIHGFDALTTKRMLQFIYKGDYSAAGPHVGAIERLSRKDSKIEDTSFSHSSRVKTQDTTSSQALVLLDEGQTTSSETAVAHVLVYAIATHFDLPLLQETAFKRFEARLAGTKAEDFSEIARVVYQNTSDDEDALRNELLFAALKRADELTACDAFVATVAKDPQLQPLVAHLLPAAVSAAKRNLETSKTLSAECDLFRTVFKELEEKLEDSEKKALKTVEELKKKSEEELKRYKNEAAMLRIMYGEKANALQASLTLTMDLQEKALATTARPRATHSDDDYIKLKAECERVKVDRDTWQAKYNKRDRALRDVKATVSNWEQCRSQSCYADFDVWLDWDDRTSSTERGLMLRCEQCRCRHYGQLIE